MAIAFRAVGTTVFSPANNIASPNVVSPTKSGSTVNGDLMLCVTVSRSITATVTTPTGWTVLTGFPKTSGTASGGRSYVFSRIADGGANDAPTVSWATVATGTSGDSCSAVILSYSGAGTVQDGTVSFSDLAAQTNTSVIPAITTGTANSLVIGVAFKIGAESGTSTVATFTERVDGVTTNGTGHVLEVSELVMGAAGSSGTATVTWSLATSLRAHAVSLAVATSPRIPLAAAAATSTTDLSGLSAPTVAAQEASAAMPAAGMLPAVNRAASY